jgi:hypothetical protein
VICLVINKALEVFRKKVLKLVGKANFHVGPIARQQAPSVAYPQAPEAAPPARR